MVSENEKISYCPECSPPTGYKRKWYTIITPEMQSWMDDNKVSYTKIPPHNPDCQKVFREGAPLITSPSNGSEYFISKKNPEPLQLICKTGNDVSKVYWYINDKFYKSGQASASQFFMPDEGPVKISCTDDKGRTRDVWIRVRKINL